MPQRAMSVPDEDTVENAAPLPRRLGAALGSAVRRGAPPVSVLLAIGAAWEAFARLSGVADYLLPTPSAALAYLVSHIGELAGHGFVTLYEALGGFAIGAFVAFVAATLMNRFQVLERAIYPLALLVKVTPVVAIAPLFVIWFGFGSFPKILIAALITFFPVMVNAFLGLRSVNPTALQFFRLLNASERDIFFKLRAPGALPYVFAAFRIAAPLSVIGAVVGEWFTGDRGLGSVIIVAHHNIDMPRLFAAIIALAVIGVGLTALTAHIERRVLFWHDSHRSDHLA